mmetsp:Transcript_21397/g.52390  ORF Transcript_21397/g.52390 Transcript_21397/m.52390 type:complete len:221 (-) Transcript_21397:209-871(-)
MMCLCRQHHTELSCLLSCVQGLNAERGVHGQDTEPSHRVRVHSSINNHTIRQIKSECQVASPSSCTHTAGAGTSLSYDRLSQRTRFTRTPPDHHSSHPSTMQVNQSVSQSVSRIEGHSRHGQPFIHSLTHSPAHQLSYRHHPSRYLHLYMPPTTPRTICSKRTLGSISAAPYAPLLASGASQSSTTGREPPRDCAAAVWPPPPPPRLVPIVTPVGWMMGG